MHPPPHPPEPSKLWYAGHVFLGIITGIVVYVLYKDSNGEAARWHLTVSLAGTVALVLGLLILAPWVSFMLFIRSW